MQTKMKIFIASGVLTYLAMNYGLWKTYKSTTKDCKKENTMRHTKLQSRLRFDGDHETHSK